MSSGSAGAVPPEASVANATPAFSASWPAKIEVGAMAASRQILSINSFLAAVVMTNPQAESVRR